MSKKLRINRSFFNDDRKYEECDDLIELDGFIFSGFQWTIGSMIEVEIDQTYFMVDFAHKECVFRTPEKINGHKGFIKAKTGDIILVSPIIGAYVFDGTINKETSHKILSHRVKVYSEENYIEIDVN